MNIPQIVFQTSSRWFVVNKPRGWALAKRSTSAEASLEGYMSNLVTDNSKLYFPQEMDTRICGLAIVCTDRGMQSQFERFKTQNNIEYTYRVVLESHAEVTDTESDTLRVTINETFTNEVDVDVWSSVFLTSRAIQDLFQHEIMYHSITLHRLKFPDPLNPRLNDISVSIPRNS